MAHLYQGMSLACQVQSLDSNVGQLRDQVVEKLRVKRLLQRLDMLLKLPVTLRQHISAGKYRWATQSYLSAYSILSKHLAGFESLQRIETDCQEIMETLLVDVRRKLVHWSGGLLEDDHDDHDDDHDKNEEEEEDVPDPPQMCGYASVDPHIATTTTTAAAAAATTRKSRNHNATYAWRDHGRVLRNGPADFPPSLGTDFGHAPH
jgi:hypothetical protein